MNGHFVLRAEEAGGGEGRHRALGADHKTFAASDESAGKTT
jgi:hypothetical protein